MTRENGPLTNMLSRAEAAAYLGMKTQTLSWWACQGIGPRFVRYGRAVRYDLADLQAFVNSKRVETVESRQASGTGNAA